jgi:hypothetical protein
MSAANFLYVADGPVPQRIAPHLLEQIGTHRRGVAFAPGAAPAKSSSSIAIVVLTA